MGFDTKDVQVKLTSGRIVRIPVIATTTTQQVCEKVAEEEKAPADVITLKFGGKVLKRSQTMWGYGVREEMELKVKLLKKETLKVHLHLPRLMLLPENDKDVVSLDIYNTSANSEILSKLKATPSVYIQYHYTLHIGDMTLEMKNRAYEDCLKDGENIIVKCTDGPQMAVEKEMGDGERQEVLNSFASSMTSRRKVDIVFSFDTTGRRYSLQSTVQDHLRDTVTRLMSDIPNIQIGLIAHGDYCDETSYVIRKHDISADMADLVQFVEETWGSGVEGPFACYEWVLRHANGLSWREDAAKALVVIGAVVPHPPSYTDMNISWRDELQDLCDKDVKVYGVQALNIKPSYSYRDKSFYSYISRKSGGAHIKFKHFSLITDMFLAACYRESGDEEIKAYVDEVEKEGRMTEEMMDVMKQLEKKPEEEDKEEEKEKDGEAEQKTEGEASVDAAAGEAEVAQPSPQRQQCYEWALRHANGLSWREDAAKALVVIGAVVPHPAAYTDMNISWRDELQDLCDKDVKVYGVQALSIYYSYVDNYSKSFYSYISRKSGGAHINFKHFSLITDMFLAACYRESGDEEIKAYVDEVEKEGRMTEEMMDVMKQLEKKPEEEDKEEEKEKGGEAKQKTEGDASVDAAAGEAEVAQPSPQRQQEEVYVRMTWWDTTLDQPVITFFTYNNETDFWTRLIPPIGMEYFSRKSSRMKKLKKGCSVM